LPAERACGRGGVGDSFEGVGAHDGDLADGFSLRDADVRGRWLGGESEGGEERDKRQEWSHWLIILRSNSTSGGVRVA
jgi:hypothetical protein